ncbi:MAG: aldo/keto reductase [Polyangiales bacterium]
MARELRRARRPARVRGALTARAAIDGRLRDRYADRDEYRTLGRTGLVVSEICFGAMAAGGDGFWRVVGAQDQATADLLVRRAFDAGVNFFDTADVYANGLSERILGEAVRRNGLRRDEVVIATKVHGRVSDLLPPDATDAQRAEADRRARAKNVNGLSRKHILDGIDASLARLGTDHVDLYQIHGYDPLTPLEEVVEALDAVVRAGKARYVGLCNLAAWQTAKALGIAERRGLARWRRCGCTLPRRARHRARWRRSRRQASRCSLEPPRRGAARALPPRRRCAEGTAARASTSPVDRPRAYDIDRDDPDGRGPRGRRHPHRAGVGAPPPVEVTSVIIGANRGAGVDNLAATDVTLTDVELAALDAASACRGVSGWMLDRQGADRLGWSRRAC